MRNYTRRKEITGPEMMRFEDIGDRFVGEFLKIRDVTTRFGAGKVADLRDLETEQVVSTFLTAQLERRLTAVKPGVYVEITYTGDEETQSGTMKEFEVYEIEIDDSPGADTQEIPF